ncbi:MAG: GGDEF domain-containing protein, partial [Actinobacteria bacterium]|nr:GGDEF domain-containing protein [Actinomycetota bacterium]
MQRPVLAIRRRVCATVLQTHVIRWPANTTTGRSCLWASHPTLPLCARRRPAIAHAQPPVVSGRPKIAHTPGGTVNRPHDIAGKQPASARSFRAEAARERELATTDPLTATWTRGPGMTELRREIDRARRTTGSLVVAFVDVDGLKQVNDTEGHLAGDRLLVSVASALREGLRSYDLIVRFGGDEFLCALSGIAPEEVKRRFDELANRLAAESQGSSISVGFAALRDSDDNQALIARADHALLRARQG